MIGGIEGIDSRAIEYRQVDFCFGGQAPIAHAVAVGMLYLVEIDDNDNVVTTMRTPAIGNPHCSGIFLSNTAFQSDGGMQVRESQEKTEKCFYSLDVPVTNSTFEQDMKMKLYNVRKDGTLTGKLRRATQAEIEHASPRAYKVNATDCIIDSCMANSIGLPGRATQDARDR